MSAPHAVAPAIGLLALTVAAFACSEPPSSAAVPSDPTLTPAVDEDPAPNVLEVSLDAREAVTSYGASTPTPVWTYGGGVPGPLFEARVGDRFVAKFTNHLPESTTIHWHGIRLPAEMDGSPLMQEPVQPGGAFRYEFTFKDAGLYWYHPHVRSDVQTHKGLYGAIVVRGDDEPTSDDERVLILDDVSVKSDGTLSESLDDLSRMMGREGKTLLVNGVPNATLHLRRGALTRLRLVNAANARFFNLRLPGFTWRVIGHDGGLLASPYDAEHVLLSPGERADVMLIPTGEAGATLELVNDPYDRGHDSADSAPMTLARVVLTDDAPLTGRALPTSFSGAARIDPAEAPASLAIALGEELRDGEVVFTVNGQTASDVPPFVVPQGGVRKLEVSNTSEMDHPFHLHGFFFQVLARDGVEVPLATMGNKDTVIVPALGAVSLVARFDEPGRWMYHCHILEHAEYGMMGEVDVE